MKSILLTLGSLVSLCLFIFGVWCLEYKRTTSKAWNEPTEYHADTYIELGYIRAVAQGDCTWLGVKEVHRLNWPGTASWQNFPMYEKVPIFILGQIAKRSNLAFAANVGVVAARVTAAIGFWLAAFGILRCSRLMAWAGAAAFSLLYYYDWRGMSHVFLCFTWTIPLFVAASWQKPKLWVLLLISFAVGLSNPYWVLGALILTIICQHGIGPRLVMLAGLASGFILSNLATILWSHKMALLRTYAENERFALKPLELLLPPPGGLFSDISARYPANVLSFLQGEMFASYLGIAGIIALGLLLLDCFRQRKALLPFAQVCALVISGSIGGLTCLLALFGLPLFRAANRLSEFVAAICLLYLARRLSNLPWSAVAKLIAAEVVIGTACLESFTFPRPHLAGPEQQKYHEDIQLGHDLDKACGGKSLYSVPPMYFPDCVIWPRIEPYDHLRPWMFTTNVSFSFGQATNKLSRVDQQTFDELNAGRVDVSRVKKEGYWGMILMRKMSLDNMDGVLKTMSPLAVSPDFIVVRLADEK